MTASTDSSPDRAWRRNLVVCAAGSFTTIIGMTLILPILPLYVEDLGVTGTAAITTWSGIAYAATFLTAALAAPLWGRLGDRFGRKPMLIRASLGMAVAMSLIGLAQDAHQLVLIRLLAGLLGGYASGSTILVAAQTPRERSAWALGVLSSAIMAGNVVGPLLGGTIAQAFGVEIAFLSTGALIFLAFLGTWLFLDETPRDRRARADRRRTRVGGWREVPHKSAVLSLLGLSMLLMFATISVEPIITVHVERLTGSAEHVAIAAAAVFSLTALGTILSGPALGRLADRVGHLRVLIASLALATVLLALQAIAPDLWTFAALRFATGIALGGVTPTVVATIRRLLPETSVGLVLGYNVSAQYVGQVAGPIAAGVLGGALGTNAVFVATAALTGAGLVAAIAIRRRFAATGD
ncbi:MFS transporter [Microbacterium sp. gxy059]|uniref:MFS transporter n=1 Tax=Microbacterium sp. gxy059 TaxID=2957199 RepID=UPI003D96BBED